MVKRNTPLIQVETEPSGVPMGGVGAGCIEMGRDGRFRNITINNNRAAAARIEVADGSFVAVRASVKGKVLTRLLQPASGVPFEAAGIIPSYTPSEQLSWRGLYPCSHYKLDDPKFPLEVTWSALAPIIPFDAEASTLPAVFLAFNVVNPTDTEVDVATLVNWENLCGCSRGHFPERRGPIRPVVLKKEEEEVREREATATEAAAPVPAGLEFGFRGEYRANAEGNYSLVAKQQEGMDVSVMAWNERSPEELLAFWEEFHYGGRLRNHLSRSEQSHSGAVCCSLTLPPKSARRILYTLTWYCPRFEVNGVDLGNGYTNKFRNAVQIAEVCLKYHKYFLSAVEAWQKRILSSSLPRWLCKMLINNNYVFSTNTLFTKDERFAMFETPSDPATGVLDRRLYSSLGVLLFFPDFEHRELLQFAITKDAAMPGRIYRSLGALCFNQPAHADGEQFDANLAFILLAYRNYCMTGNLVILKNTWPRIKEAMEYLLRQDIDGDGLPEQPGCSTVLDGCPVHGVNSYTGSLWLATLRAYVKLAGYVGQPQEVKRYNTVLIQARESFEQRLWNDQDGYYRLYDDKRVAQADHEARNETCHSAQLAGQWFSDFVCLGRLVSDERIERAIRAMNRLTEKPRGVAHAGLPEGIEIAAESLPRTERGWPLLSTAYYSSLLIAHGMADRGLHTVQKIHQSIHAIRGLTFNQSVGWNLETNLPLGEGRHLGSLAIWHVLYALQGFHLNLPDQTLWIRPNLPKNVRQLSAPLFTPACLGWLNFHEDDTRGYTQTLEISLDSPVHAKIIVLRIPSWVEEVAIQCMTTTGEEPTRHILGYDGKDHLLEIQPRHTIVVGNSLTITVKGTRFGKRPTA